MRYRYVRTKEAQMLRKSIQMFVAVGLWLVLGGTALAQGPQPQSSDLSWVGWYWNNMSLSGNPILQRNDSAINFDWGLGSPDPVVHSDQFSARWTRTVETASGFYRFSA